MVEPLLDVFSLTIFPTNLPCAVHGDITVYDKLDSIAPTYELYRRDAEHAELISELGQALSAVGLDKVLLFQQPVISFNLKVKDSSAAEEEEDAFIARGTANLDIDTNNDYEEVKQSDVKGDCGHATVNYIALSCALVAHIDIRLCGYWDAAADAHQHTLSQQDSDLKSSLYGTIIAQYGNSFGNADQFRISLLNVPSHQSIPLFFEDNPMPTVKLTRNYFAVPAYSCLKIKGNLRSTLSSMSVVDEEDTVIVWSRHGPPSSKSHRNTVPERCLNVFETTTNWLPLYLVQRFSGHPTRKPSLSGEKIMLEVFSVFIGRINDHNLNVSGTITFEQFNRKLAFFERHDKNPDKLLDGRKLLAITCPSIIEFCSPCIIFAIAVKLMDANRRFLIEGNVTFNSVVTDDVETMFNTPLCSVIPSDNGYCALHYTMFDSATKVTLEIVLLCKGVGVDVARVHGKIVAWSDMFDYTRDYNKKYHRRILYDEPNAQIYYPQKAAPNTTKREYGKVKLSESCVAVPIDFSYNIGVDLYASSHTRSGQPQHLQKTLQLQYDKNKRMKKMHIAVGDFVLCVQNV